MVQQATIIDLVRKLSGKDVDHVVKANNLFFKFKDITTPNGQLSKTYNDYATQRIGRYHQVAGIIYIDLVWTIETILKQREKHQLCAETLVELINSINESIHSNNCSSSQQTNIGQSLSQNANISNLSNTTGNGLPQTAISITEQTNGSSLSENVTLPNTNSSQLTNTTSSSIPNPPSTPKRQRLQEIDGQNKKKAKIFDLQEQNVEEKKEKNAKRREKRKTSKKTPSKKTLTKNNKAKEKIDDLNNALSNFRNHEKSIKKNKFVNLSDLNLISAGTDRSPIITHNSFRSANPENSFNSTKKSCDAHFTKLTEMAHLCEEESAHILFHFFRKNPIFWMEIGHAISMCYRHPVADQESYNGIRKFYRSTSPSVESQLKTKDEGGYSDNSWKEIAFLTNSNLKASLTEETKKYNGLVVKYFNFEQVQNGFRVKLLPLVLAAVKGHLHQMNVRKKSKLPLKGKTICNDLIEGGIFLPDNLQLKISMDGRKLEKLGTVVVTLQILNLHTYGTQDPHVVFPIAIYIGDEKDVLLYMKDFEEEVKELAENGLNISYDDDDIELGFPKLGKNNEKTIINIGCEFYWVSDLKSLSYVSILKENNCFCIGCDCTQDSSVISLDNGHIYDERDLCHKFGIKNVYFCVLHMDERVTEYLLKMVLISGCHNTIRNKFDAINGLKGFSFSDKEKDEQAMNISDYAFMLTGAHCARIFGNFQNIFGFLKEKKETESLYIIWEQWQRIRRWIYFTNEQLALKSKTQFQLLREEIQSWGNNINTIRKSCNTVGDYIHIVVNHFYHLLTNIGSLVPFSNQAVEHSHKYDRWLMQRCTSRAKMAFGSVNKVKVAVRSDTFCEDSSTLAVHVPNPNNNQFNYDNIITYNGETTWNDLFQICQIFLKKLRILYLSFKFEDVTFKRLEKRIGKCQRKFWERDVNNIGLPLQHLELEDHESLVGVHSPTSQQSLTREQERELAEFHETNEIFVETPPPTELLFEQNVPPLIGQTFASSNHPEDDMFDVLDSFLSSQILEEQTEEDCVIDPTFNEPNTMEIVGQDDQEFLADFPEATFPIQYYYYE